MFVGLFFSQRLPSSFAGILYKYILKSKATTPSKPSCLLNSISNQIRNPGDQFHGFSDLVFVSFLFQNGPKGCSLTFPTHLWYVCSMMYKTNTGQVLKPNDDPSACFQRIQDIDLDSLETDL